METKGLLKQKGEGIIDSAKEDTIVDMNDGLPMPTLIPVPAADHSENEITESAKEDTIVDMNDGLPMPTLIPVPAADHSENEITESAKEDTIVDMELLEKLKVMSTEDAAKEFANCCIYRVPWHVREKNPQAYTPKLVSFGPYHHGSPHLMEMELHKHRALAHVLRRYKKPFQHYVKVLEPLTECLMESYGNLDAKWKDPQKFLQLMVLDGFFWLEIDGYLNKDEKFQSDCYENDPMFSSRAAPLASTDMLDDMAMLENQLPGILIRTLSLHSKQTTQPREEQRKQEGIEQVKSKEPLHFLDKKRNEIVGPRRESTERLNNLFYSASELHNVGVVFKKKDIEKDLLVNLDITFDKDKGILSLPLINVRMEAESRMLNMVAFEHLHRKSHEISAYIEFIGLLLRAPRDVQLLRSERIIFSDRPHAKKIVEYLTKLRHDMRYFPKSTPYEELRADMRKYHDKNTKKWTKRFREWRVEIQEKYFKYPWSVCSVVAAIVALGLTALGTTYTVIKYYKSNP